MAVQNITRDVNIKRWFNITEDSFDLLKEKEISKQINIFSKNPQ